MPISSRPCQQSGRHGYGAAQAVPGPLFTFDAYLGAVMHPEPSGWLGGIICLAAIFLPSLLLLLGILPFWEHLRKMNKVRTALMGINAAVVGLLLAVFTLQSGQAVSCQQPILSWHLSRSACCPFGEFRLGWWS